MSSTCSSIAVLSHFSPLWGVCVTGKCAAYTRRKMNKVRIPRNERGEFLSSLLSTYLDMIWKNASCWVAPSSLLHTHTHTPTYWMHHDDPTKRKEEEEKHNAALLLRAVGPPVNCARRMCETPRRARAIHSLSLAHTLNTTLIWLTISYAYLWTIVYKLFLYYYSYISILFMYYTHHRPTWCVYNVGLSIHRATTGMFFRVKCGKNVRHPPSWGMNIFFIFEQSAWCGC